MSENKPVFRIVEEKKDPMESVIERTAPQSNTFTLYEVGTNRKQLKKLKREIEAQCEVSEAKVANIEENYPFTKKLTAEEGFAAHMREEALALIRGAKPKLEEIENALKDLDEDEAEIERQIGIAIPVESLGPTGPVDLSPKADGKE